jgi:Zn-dependent peptidase ImmA (M78 family)
LAKLYTRESIEQQASTLLTRYFRKTGLPVLPPVCVENIVDVALANELGSVLWDTVIEPSGSAVLGCLDEDTRVIILNETRRELLLETPGLVNTTIAHEIGHWQLHTDRSSRDQASLPGFDSLPSGPITSEINPWDEKNAHRFMASLLMPREMLIPHASAIDLSSWPGLYALREQFDVTITALKIRLEELGFTYVDKYGVFHGSRAESVGQQRIK